MAIDSNCFPVDELLTGFRDLLDCINHGELALTQQPKYIKAFLFVYFAYINKVISSQLPELYDDKDMKIGFSISIEKMLLDEIISTKKALKELIFASGLVQRNDSSKKLRVTIQGEGLFSIIQKEWNLNTPVKSCFVLAQLKDDYIQLTLSQVVTDADLEGKQEAIILKDKIISIQNVYDTLCINLWNNITLNSSIIHLCNLHSENEDNCFLFSLKTKAEFTKYLRDYISNLASVNYIIKI